jgi:branched-chain amino acid transport system permease protein
MFKKGRKQAMADFIQLFLNCLVLSANYVLLAVGLTLIFGILTTLNFAHGSMYITGAYVVFALFKEMGINYFLAFSAAILLVAGIGFLLEKAFLYPLSNRTFLAAVGAILGVNLVLEGILAFIFGGEDVATGSLFSGTVSVGGATLSIERIMIVILCGLIMLGVYVWIKKTKQGIAIRALAADPRVAQMQGINVAKIRLLVMIIAAALAAGAGVIITPLFFVNPFMGGNVVFKALLVIAVGGMGSIEGSILAGLLIGFVETIGLTYLGPIAQLVPFIFVIILFLFRQRGLMGVVYEFH